MASLGSIAGIRESSDQDLEGARKVALLQFRLQGLFKVLANAPRGFQHEPVRMYASKRDFESQLFHLRLHIRAAWVVQDAIDEDARGNLNQTV